MMGYNNYEYCWFIIIYELQAHRWYFKCSFPNAQILIIHFKFAVGFKQYLFDFFLNSYVNFKRNLSKSILWVEEPVV